MYRLRILIAWLLLALLVGCTGSVQDREDLIGGSTPQAVAANFFEDFNTALEDPAINTPETRRIWAERLAGYFTPVERADQRLAIRQALANFAYQQANVPAGEALTLRITYTAIAVLTVQNEEAMVQLVDGRFVFQRFKLGEGDPQLIREQIEAIGTVLGMGDAGFPVHRVNGRWFMTER